MLFWVCKFLITFSFLELAWRLMLVLVDGRLFWTGVLIALSDFAFDLYSFRIVCKSAFTVLTVLSRFTLAGIPTRELEALSPRIASTRVIWLRAMSPLGASATLLVSPLMVVVERFQQSTRGLTFFKFWRSSLVLATYSYEKFLSWWLTSGVAPENLETCGLCGCGASAAGSLVSIAVIIRFAESL